MSNNLSNQEQNELVVLSPNQSDPARALPTDFIVRPNTEAPATPLHGQHGRTVAERRKLMTEGHQPQPLPERHTIPLRPTRAK